MDTRSSGATQALGEDAFRRVVEWAPTAMVLIDGAGRIALINAQAERLFGYSREDLQGQTVECLIPERYTATHGGFREGFFANPHPRPMGSGRDLYARHQDGSEFPVEIGLNPIDTPEGTMVLASIVDMSERRRAQQRIANALAEKTVLLNEVHHRVKNNLQLVSSLLNLQAMEAFLWDGSLSARRRFIGVSPRSRPCSVCSTGPPSRPPLQRHHRTHSGMFGRSTILPARE